MGGTSSIFRLSIGSSIGLEASYCTIYVGLFAESAIVLSGRRDHREPRSMMSATNGAERHIDRLRGSTHAVKIKELNVHQQYKKNNNKET